MAALLHLTDTHCHLNFNLFDEDRAAALERARAVGVRRILNPGIDLATSQAAIGLAQEDLEVFAAVGVHPNDANQWDEGTYQKLAGLAASPKVVAIGEIGLDYYRDRAAPEVQRKAFREQLRLAKETGLPVVIHNREASADIMPILEEWCADLERENSPLARQPGVLHSYSGNEAFAQRVIGLGFFIGITGPVTYPNAQTLRKVASSIPLDHLLVETDSPFLAPQAQRGQRNEPAYVSQVVEKIAELRNESAAQVAEKTAANAGRLFHW